MEVEENRKFDLMARFADALDNWMKAPVKAQYLIAVDSGYPKGLFELIINVTVKVKVQ